MNTIRRAIETSGWVLRRLGEIRRRQGLRGVVRRGRAAALLRAHTVIERGRRVASRPDPTTGKAELERLTIQSGDVAAGIHFLSTPWAILDLVHAAMPAEKSAWAFVDLGAGKGRALLSAAGRGYREVLGIEFARELVVAAGQNLLLAGHVPPRVRIVEGDAATAELPEGPLVVFLFNPFGPPVIEAVARRLAAEAAKGVRPIIVAYLNPEHAEVFRRQGVFRRRSLNWRNRLLVATISPYELDIFESAGA